MTRLARTLALFLLLSPTGCHTTPPATTTPKPGGLEADPKWLTFQCIKPGCDTRLPVDVTQVGSRHIAVKRIVLSDARPDFSIELPTGLNPPFVVPDGFTIHVRHVPKPGGDTGDVSLLVTYTDATADDSPDRVKPGELTIPLLRRLVGEAAMAATPALIVFGAAFNGDSLTQPLTLSNTGYGNISLDIASVVSDSPDIVPGALPHPSLSPGEKMDVPVVFTANQSRFTQATITVNAIDSTIPAATVKAIATSLNNPLAAADPATVDFGEVPRHQAKTITVEVLNQGGSELDISGLLVGDGTDTNVVALLPKGATTAALQPLESVVLSVQLTAQTAGPVDTTVQVTTNNPHANTLVIPVTGTVIEPKATPTPAVVDFGNVFKGWTQTLPVTIENTGYGDLLVKGITLVGGTSDLFTLRTLPIMPATLKRGQRLGLEVAFRADAQATFQGGISVETNDPTGNFLQIPLKAVGTTCELACPTPNAAPTCTSGACALATCTGDTDCDTLKCHAGVCCDKNHYDVDGKWDNGCECQDLNDTGPFCADAANLGEMNSNHTSASFTGVLPYPGDVNTVRFSSDSHCFLCSGHTIYVNLTSADPTISMCVFVKSGGDCPTDADQNVCSNGVSSTAESSTFLVKVTRKAGSAPTCTPFTVTVSHQ